MCLLSFLKWGSIGYSLGIVRWDFTRQEHPRNPRRVSGSGPVTLSNPLKGISMITSGATGSTSSIGSSSVVAT